MNNYRHLGQAQALQTLGLTKEAFWGLLGRGLAGAGKLIGKGLFGIGKGAYNLATAPAERLFSGVGNTGLKFLENRRINTQTLRGLGQGMAKDMAGFGLLGGGLGAYSADPGERMSGFARGFAGGALGGMGWRLGSNAATMGAKWLAPKGYAALENVAKPGWFSGGLKGFGANLVTGGVPLAGGLGASMLMPNFEKKPPQHPYLQRAIPGALSNMTTPYPTMYGSS